MTDNCRLWQGYIDSDGYGRVWFDRRVHYAHRVMYELLVGPIPDELQIDHLCRVRACVNPAHLEPVTTRENTLRGEGPAAVHARKTTCPQGHAYSHIDSQGAAMPDVRRRSQPPLPATKASEAVKPVPCPKWRTPHWRLRADAEEALRSVGLLNRDGRNSPADVHPCPHCQQWTYTLRPTHGDAA